MESVSQFVLGASVTAVALGGRTSLRRSLPWGGVVATLPDLDVLIDYGDAIANMTRHRADSHALCWLTLASPLLAWGIAALHGERAQFRRWWFGVWLALVTHPLLDLMTVYGTQLLRPFDSHPYAIGSLFVIDPLYTLPLLLGCVAGWRRRDARGLAWVRAGLVLSCLYAAWSVVAWQWATSVARAALARQGIPAARLVVTPAPLQTLLWRLVAVTDEVAYEGFWSVCDGARPPRFAPIDRGAALRVHVRDNPAAARLAWFAGDCTKLARDGEAVRITDLRMGQEPYYVFSFVVAHVAADGTATPVAAPVRSGARIDLARGLPWLWARMWGADVPPPR